MAYDGVFIKAQINEIKDKILDEHIARINENSNKEIEIIIRKNGENLVLTLSANPNFPHILLTTEDSEKFVNPPAFCMLLRKYLQGGYIKRIKQIGGKVKINFDKNKTLERIVDIEVENVNDSGDKENYHLYIEIMGKYSNIIITDNDNIILDVLHKDTNDNARLKQKEKYSIRDICSKIEIFDVEFNEFVEIINEELSLSLLNNETFNICNAITKRFAGLSKSFVTHILNSLKINPQITEFNSDTLNNLYDNLIKTISNLTDEKSYKLCTPCINFKGDKPSDFYLMKLAQYEGDIITFKSINDCLNEYIGRKFVEIKESTEKKNVQEIIKNLFVKLTKKLDIYNKDLSKCEGFEKYKNWGELVSAFGYNNPNNKDGILTVEDYNNNNELVHIPYDDSKTVSANVEFYYDKYNKLKRTKENALKLIDETNDKLEHLNSIKESLDLSNDKEDIYLIKEELIKYFDETSKIQSLAKQKTSNRARESLNKTKLKSKLNYNLHHYKSSTGIDIYVGKNNLQNEFLTFTMADPSDTWLHIKDATGSHVIVKKPYEFLDDKTLIEAASLAAYFSEKKNETKATVDYTLRKELKKVKGKAPGFCIYHKNYSINVKPEVLLKEI